MKEQEKVKVHYGPSSAPEIEDEHQAMLERLRSPLMENQPIDVLGNKRIRYALAADRYGGNRD